MMKTGQQVKLSKCVETGDDVARFVIMELRGDRVLVQSCDSRFDSWAIKPTFVYLVADLEIAA